MVAFEEDARGFLDVVIGPVRAVETLEVSRGEPSRDPRRGQDEWSRTEIGQSHGARLPEPLGGVTGQHHSRIVVVGVCMGADTIRPALAVNKELDLRFVVGYTPLEFRDTLHALADGTITASPIVTGRVGLAGVADAFTSLADPDNHAKVLIEPSLDTDHVTG